MEFFRINRDKRAKNENTFEIATILEISADKKQLDLSPYKLLYATI